MLLSAAVSLPVLAPLLATLVLGESHPVDRTRGLARRNSTAGYALKPPPLTTPWTDAVGIEPWPDYPRPQLRRSEWQTLNGVWQWQNAPGADAVNSPPFRQNLSEAVLVPFCLESGLSGIQAEVGSVIWSWYATHFTVPSTWFQRVLLHFGAVDYEATVFVNGKNASFHRGGYFAFQVDVTDFLTPGPNEL